jgi:hypothetical protein
MPLKEAKNRPIEESFEAAYSKIEKYDCFIDTHNEFERIMGNWDYYRNMIAKGDRGSMPRDWFESVLEFVYSQGFKEGAQLMFKENHKYPLKD